jgi:hypothetical protein
MKLKQIAQEVINEIALMSGDADNASSLQLLESNLTGWDDLRKVVPESFTGSAPLDGRVRAFIKKSAIDKQGTLYICKYNRFGRDCHVLFKIDEPYATTCVGQIDTELNRNAFSISNIFGIDAPQVHWSIIADEYKGMKYGAFLYDTLLYMYGALESDSVLYKGSLNMWVHHMSATGRITTATINNPNYYSDQRVVMPITIKDLKDADYLKRIDSIAVFYDVPSELQAINNFVNGLSLRNGSLGLIYFEDNLDRPNTFETFDATAGLDQKNEDATLSMADFLDQYSYDDLIEMTQNGEVAFGKTSHMSMQDSNALTSLYWNDITKSQKVILVCKDAIVLVEPMGDEINYKIM